MLAPHMALLFWLLPVALLVCWLGGRQRHRALARFAGVAGPRLMPAGDRRPLKTALLLAVLALMVTALCRPAWQRLPKTIHKSGRDIIVLLDVSRSMLAQDLRPNRLERAKLLAADLVSGLTGDRVALVAVAGEPRLLCPLTVDYGFFRQALEAVDVTSAPRGGTMLGDGIRYIVKRVLDAKPSHSRDVVILTDGGDHGSLPEAAAAEAANRGVRFLVVGLGDAKEGARIPVTDERGRRTFLRDDHGREVWARLEDGVLRKIVAAAPGSSYLPVGTGTVDLARVYRKLAAGGERHDTGTETTIKYKERFQLFVAAALCLLLLETMLADFRQGRRRWWPLAVVLLLGWGSLAPPPAAAGDDLGRGNRAYEAGRYDEALAAYQEALQEEDNTPVAQFNRGAALYRLGRFQEAAAAFARAENDPELAARAAYNRGTALLQAANRLAATAPEEARPLLETARQALRRALDRGMARDKAGRNLELANRKLAQLAERPQATQGQHGDGQGGGQQGHRQDTGENKDTNQGRQAGSDPADLAAAQEALNRRMANGETDPEALAREQQQLAAASRKAADKAQRGAGEQNDANGHDGQPEQPPGTPQNQKNEKNQKNQEMAAAAAKQEQAAQALERHDLDEAQRLGEEAAQLLRRAAGSSPANTGRQGTKGDAEHSKEVASPAPPLAAPDPASRILQEERLRQRQRATAGRPAPVGKDW